MSKVTLMAGTPRSLCRAWTALQELERNRGERCRAPGCPVKSDGERQAQRPLRSDI